MSDVNLKFNEFLFKLGTHLGFFLFDNKDNYKYVGPFHHEDPKKIVLHTKLLIDNTISAYQRAIASNPEKAKEGVYDYMLNKISIDIIVPPFFEKEDIFDKVKKIANKKYERTISIYYRTDINNIIGDEYKKIGDVKLASPRSK